MFIPGPMEEDMKDNMRWIRNMASVYITGPTAEFTKANGIMENNTDKVNTFYKMEISSLENG